MIAYIEQKTKIIMDLMDLIENTSKTIERKEALLFLIKNFKDRRIKPFLKKMILSDKFKNKNALFVYALGEYDSCIDDLEFLIDLILTQDYHVALNAYSIIGDYYPEFKENDLKSSLELLQNTKKISEEKKEFINDIENFLKNELNFE